MKISINNFKTIKELKDLEIKPLNVISGVNSSGKTSFIQFLLLLKQTLEAKAANRPLIFNSEEYVKLGEYSEVVYDKRKENNISFDIGFTENEISFSELEFLKIKGCNINVVYSLLENDTVIQTLEFKYSTPEFIKKEHWIKFTKSGDSKYVYETNTAVFNAEFEQVYINNESNQPGGDLSFIAFMPQLFVTEINNPNYPEIDKNPLKKISIEPKTKELQALLEKYFDELSYIGPLREIPKDSYSPNKNNNNIGAKGQYAAYFLETEGLREINYYKIEDIKNESIQYKLSRGSLADAVKYWICDVLQLAKEIKTEEYKDEFIVKIVNHFGIETTIKHVGFGISQILPIIVEGLRMVDTGILILEQPEIHLHPKIQSSLFDFLNSLIISGKKIIVETHSAEFITRMRRRIAEDSSNTLVGKVNLIFVEEDESEHIFKELDLSESGSLSYFPKDFIEQSEIDYRAIVKAQALKRQNKK
ncbi:MAG TPA: AAA family ATPase [Chitinophagales bacterium]|nr:AAA family ATPase [Chitinophagales bacterium]